MPEHVSRGAGRPDSHALHRRSGQLGRHKFDGAQASCEGAFVFSDSLAYNPCFFDAGSSEAQGLRAQQPGGPGMHQHVPGLSRHLAPDLPRRPRHERVQHLRQQSGASASNRSSWAASATSSPPCFYDYENFSLRRLRDEQPRGWPLRERVQGADLRRRRDRRRPGSNATARAILRSRFGRARSTASAPPAAARRSPPAAACSQAPPAAARPPRARAAPGRARAPEDCLAVDLELDRRRRRQVQWRYRALDTRSLHPRGSCSGASIVCNDDSICGLPSR